MSNPLLPKPREMWVELLSGDFEPRKQELERLLTEGSQAEAAERDKPSSHRFAEVPKVAQIREENERLAAEYDALMEEARESGIVRILLRSAGRPWRALKDEHPPRPDNEVDEMLGVNRLSFFEPAVRLCIVEPEATDEQYEEFVAGLSSAQWERVCSTAWAVNEGEVSIPKSSAVSLLQRMRDDDSKPAESTESTPEPSTESQPSSATTALTGS